MESVQKKNKIARRLKVGQEIGKKGRVGDEITGPGHPNWSRGARYTSFKK